MIIQIPGKRYAKWFSKEENETTPVLNVVYSLNYPLTTQAFNTAIEDLYVHKFLGADYHQPEVVKSLPPPNNYVSCFENSPHVWHFKDTETQIEFVFISDAFRKDPYKGTSIQVLCDKNKYFKDDQKLSTAYNNLMTYVRKCYLDSLETI